jgi:hypothetical protein
MRRKVFLRKRLLAYCEVARYLASIMFPLHNTSICLISLTHPNARHSGEVPSSGSYLPVPRGPFPILLS